MKRKLIALALLASIFTSCSNDDAPIEEPIVPVPVEKCNCKVSRYKIMTTMAGTPLDTILIQSNYIGDIESPTGLHQEECGADYWVIDLTTYSAQFGDTNPFFYEVDNHVTD